MSPPDRCITTLTRARKLKALATLHPVIRTLLDAGQKFRRPPQRARRFTLCWVAKTAASRPYIPKLWREAQILADRDPHQDAYLLTMQMWHEETVTIIEAGQTGRRIYVYC